MTQLQSRLVGPRIQVIQLVCQISVMQHHHVPKGCAVAQTGFPHMPTTAPKPANTTPVRANQLRVGKLPCGQRTADRWYETTAFAATAAFNYRNSTSNILCAPGLVNLDLMIARNFQLTKRFCLEYRGEMLNATNSVYSGRPNLTMNAGQGGRITTMQTLNRNMQFGLWLWL